jgi:hypothetical protein
LVCAAPRVLYLWTGLSFCTMHIASWPWWHVMHLNWQ